MRWSQTLIPTRKELPTGGKSAGLSLLIRAGLAHESSGGAVSLLPLGLRALRKAEQIAREEFASAGFGEVLVPVQVGGGSGVITAELAAAARSYKQFPLRLFSARPRPKGSVIFEAWSFTAPGAAQADPAAAGAELRQVLVRCGIVPVSAESAVAAPGEVGLALVVPMESGRAIVLSDDRGGHAALTTVARTGARPWTFGQDSVGELERVHTPRLTSVEQVSAFLNIQPGQVLKTLVFRTDAAGPALASGVDPRWVVAVVRGDHSVSEAKLGAVVRETFHVGLRPLTDDPQPQQTAGEWAIGFVGPDAAMRKPDAVLVVDYDAANGASWVAGANEAEYHVRHFNWFRECGDRLADPRKTVVADIRPAQAGDPSPRGGTLVATAGEVVAEASPWGDRWTRAAGANVTLADGTTAPARLVAWRLDLTLLLTAAAERSRDDHGIVWPAPLAPFCAVVTALNYDGPTREAADRLYEQLNAAGIDTILDDRDARPGVKFADADLVGFPVRVTVGERGLKEGAVEVKARKTGQVQKVPLDAVVGAVRALLAE